MKTLTLLLALLTLPLYAQSVLDLTDAEKDPSAEEILLKKPEKYLRNESMIYDFDSSLGIKDQRRWTGQDKNRISLAGHVSFDYEHLTEIQGLDFTYMRRAQNYSQFWYGFQIFRNQTRFDAVTQNPSPSSSTNVNSDAQKPRPNDAKEAILAGGLGVGYRFKFFLDFFETENVFESVDVFANYVQMDDDFLSQTYTGYGLTTNYGIHKRSSTSFFYGMKFSYNLASVTRPKLGDEKSRERSLTLGWGSLALEIGSFF
jgi:hypothetical protein